LKPKEEEEQRGLPSRRIGGAKVRQSYLSAIYPNFHPKSDKKFTAKKRVSDKDAADIPRKAKRGSVIKTHAAV
jgi:hypothetical protein